jgi:hypothetical protein
LVASTAAVERAGPVVQEAVAATALTEQTEVYLRFPDPAEPEVAAAKQESEESAEPLATVPELPAEPAQLGPQVAAAMAETAETAAKARLRSM